MGPGHAHAQPAWVVTMSAARRLGFVRIVRGSPLCAAEVDSLVAMV